MEGERARLVPAPPPEDAEVGQPDPGDVAGSRSARDWRLWALLLLLAVVAYGLQVRRGARLEERVALLEAELATARAALESHREHLQEVRGAVAGVRGELDALESLVSREPEPQP